VHTRRDTFILMSTLPLFATEALADDDINSIFNAAIVDLQSPLIVNQNYRTLAFYLEVLSAEKAKPEDIFAVQKTYQLLGERIQQTEGKFEKDRANDIMPALKSAYQESRAQLLVVLKVAGIEARSIAAWIVEKAIASMLFTPWQPRLKRCETCFGAFSRFASDAQPNSGCLNALHRKDKPFESAGSILLKNALVETVKAH
jgi:hypothetical protein